MEAPRDEVVVTVRDAGGRPLGRITRDAAGRPVAEVLDEGGRGLVEAVAARMAAPRRPRPRPSC